MMVEGFNCHDELVAKTKQKLCYSDEVSYSAWKEQVKNKLFELLGLDIIAENACEPNFKIVEEKQKEGYKQIRFEFESEHGSVVPCYVLIPDLGKEKYPVVITLQGHSSGFHNSIKEPLEDDYIAYALTRGCFAVQAVKKGYIAVAIEQRAMGERATFNTPKRRVSVGVGTGGCYNNQMTAFMLGRTTIGERCWDISRTIDMLKHFPQCDMDKIAITGNSGGGTTSYYAACCDERIKISAPSCAFCPYPESILKFYHCSCNYIPQAFRWFDMQDLACLIAPRRLVIIAGRYDTCFLIEGVERGYKTVEKIFKKEGVENNCRLIITENEHWWCEDIVWPAIDEEFKKLG